MDLPSVANLDALQADLQGEVGVPGSPAYDSVRPPAVARFRDVRPHLVVRCATPEDVAEAIAFARRHGLAMTARSGGHCFAGRSSTHGLLIDVSPMRSVSVDGDVATVQAGAVLGDVYDELAPHGVTIAAGCGPGVGIAGLALGGGLGILGRKHGLTCDQLVGAQVVLADGNVVDCSEHEHEDLFWALRGAGGCQFGVVTSLALRTVPAPQTTTLHLRWPLAQAASVLDAWQRFAPDAPDELAASLLVTAGRDAGRPSAVHVFGAMLAGRSHTTELLDQLVARAGADPAATDLRELPYRLAKRHLSEHGPGEELSPGEELYTKSEFFRRPLPSAVGAALVAHLAESPARGQVRVLDLTPWGGAYNRVGEDATAFAHRAERFLLKHDAMVDAGAAPAEREAARTWVARSWALVHPHGSGGVYPNFPDPDLSDWARAYHGRNHERLLAVKARYDPEDRFRFGQSLPLAA